jgi:putative Mg2+ transporter-C (MgtC) family protein
MVSEVEIIVRFAMASFLGGIIGLEREIHGREAGIRTYLLVSLGSALIMVISENLAAKYHQGAFSAILRGDPGRIAAQAITGIGFLGAGVILRYKETIRGLTTASCMWVVCAIGLCVGAGFYLSGFIVSAIALGALVGLKRLEKKISRDWYQELLVVSEDVEGQVERIREIIEKHDSKVTGFGIKRSSREKEINLNFRFRFRAARPDCKLDLEVFGLQGIKQVELKSLQ